MTTEEYALGRMAMEAGVPAIPKSRPILFSAPMVRAILDGRKTQTRRVVKKDPGLLGYGLTQTVMDGAWYPTTPSGKIGTVPPITCPFGKPGDLLWVRESCWIAPVGFAGKRDCNKIDSDGLPRMVGYIADSVRYAKDHGVKMSPSIFMPRWASRIDLSITSIRVERLQEISEADAIAEGVGRVAQMGIMRASGYKDYMGAPMGCWDAASSYATLWESINGAGSWDANPWVFVISFERAEAKP